MNKPSRRAVVRTGVWAVPVVATAAAAPAFAGTGTPPPVVILGVGAGCKVPGNSGRGDPKEYSMVITFDNTSATNQDVTITKFKIDGKPTTGFIVPTTVTGLVPGQTPYLITVTSTASSQRTATITYSVERRRSSSPTVTFPDFDPCNCKKNAEQHADCAPERAPAPDRRHWVGA